MAEQIFQRVRRILNARLEDAVDRMERSGSDSVMREAIREVGRAIDQIQVDYEAVMSSRLLAVRQQKALRKKAIELTDKAKFALAEGREDLAEAALGRQVDFEEQAGKLDAVWTQAGEEEVRLSENLAALKTRKQQMEEALDAFLASRRDAALGGDEPTKPPRWVERRVDRAEKAFERAMSNAGRAGYTRPGAEAISRVAEIDVMQKHALVAARLAALKQAPGSV
jgi:phage shock protein A